MSVGSSAKEISLGDSFGEVAVKANGIRIELHADGSVDAYTAGAVKVHHAANDALFIPPVASSDVSRLLAKATHKIGAIESTGEHKGEKDLRDTKRQPPDLVPGIKAAWCEAVKNLERAVNNFMERVDEGRRMKYRGWNDPF